MKQPAVIVFDLDFTLWDCGGTWCDCLWPPFRKAGSRVLDAHDSHVRLYPDVQEILDEIDSLGIPLAVASRTEQPGWARELLSLLGIRDRFTYEEIFPGSKIRHFERIREASGFTLEEMLFFDDEPRNLYDLEPMGVRCRLVRNGLNWQLFQDGLALF